MGVSTSDRTGAHRPAAGGLRAIRSWAFRAPAIGGLAVILLLVAPGPALACPVCGLSGTDDSNGAYIAMTVMLSALPLAMIAGVAAWVRRRISADELRSTETGAPPRP